MLVESSRNIINFTLVLVIFSCQKKQQQTKQCHNICITGKDENNSKLGSIIRQTFSLSVLPQASCATHMAVYFRTCVSVDAKGSTRACMPSCNRMLDLMISCSAILERVAAELATVLEELSESCWMRISWPPASYTALEDTMLVDCYGHCSLLQAQTI